MDLLPSFPWTTTTTVASLAAGLVLVYLLTRSRYRLWVRREGLEILIEPHRSTKDDGPDSRRSLPPGGR